MVGIVPVLSRFIVRLHGAVARRLVNDRSYTLLHNARMQRQIIQANPSGVILVDALAFDMPIIYANQAFEQITGYRWHEVVGTNCRFLQGNDRNQPGLDTLRRALAQQQPCTVTLRNYRKDGTLFWNEVRIAPLTDLRGRVTHFVGIQNDVTARKAAEMRYRSLFEQSNDAVYILDLTAKIIQANERGVSILGYDSLDNIVGHAAMSFIAPHSRAEMESRLERLLAGERLAPYERDFQRKDGSMFTAEVNAEIVHDEAGRPLHIQSIVRDIGDRKQAQQRKLELALEKQRAELLMYFIRKATHEFRTPLAVIGSSAYLMSRSNDVQQRHNKLEQIESEITHITRLVDMLLLLTRLEVGGTMVSAPIEIQMLVGMVCEAAQAAHGGSPQLDYLSTVEALTIHGNYDYLVYAVNHVLDNAFRYTPADGKISVRLASSNGNVSLTVKDTGAGIAETDLPHIFETFWRRDETHSTPGFGLGLAIVKRIIELHGGSVAVASRVGEGTVFEITLPTQGARAAGAHMMDVSGIPGVE